MFDVRRSCSSSVSGNRSLGVRLAGGGPGNCPDLDCLRDLVLVIFAPMCDADS